MQFAPALAYPFNALDFVRGFVTDTNLPVEHSQSHVLAITLTFRRSKQEQYEEQAPRWSITKRQVDRIVCYGEYKCVKLEIEN